MEQEAPTKRDLITCILKKRWPNRVVPTGGFAYVAEEAGASRPFVSKVARELGYVPEAPHRRSRRPEGCQHCGRRVDPGKRVCQECTYVTVACDTCGKLFKRRRDRIFESARNPRYNDGIFCSRRCVYERRYRITWRPHSYLP